MRQYKAFRGRHEDFVHDVVYDHYGLRLATCSSDHKIKVWSENAAGEWQCDAVLDGHRAAVWKLAWAHPEYGQVLASCGFDHQVLVWEELDTPVSKQPGTDDPAAQAAQATLAGGDSAGVGTGVGMGQTPGGVGVGAVGAVGAAGAVGADGEGEGGGAGSGDGATVEVASRWHTPGPLKADGAQSVNDMQFAPRHCGLCLATCSTDGFVRIFSADDVMNLDSWSMSEKFAATKEGGEATSLSWNMTRFDDQMLVVGSAGRVLLWAKNSVQRRWDAVAEMETSAPNSVVNDLCWAPNLGRSYHLVAASASNSESVDIWKLSWDAATGAYSEVRKDCELACKSEVWRCEWNVTGTVLATSGDDGTIRLWRKNFHGKWNLIAEETLAT